MPPWVLWLFGILLVGGAATALEHILKTLREIHAEVKQARRAVEEILDEQRRASLDRRQ